MNGSPQHAGSVIQITIGLDIDDDPIAAESLADFLSEEGHKAGFVLSAEEAIASLREAAAGVVITDVSMPGMGGVELLRRVYETAVAAEYRFYSYGDAMLVV